MLEAAESCITLSSSYIANSTI